VLDKTNFRAGSSPECEVIFDPLADAGAANRSASFRLMEDGWYIAHTTGVILINQREVAGPTRIRSGDVVRMSESGPDFSFIIMTNIAAKQTKSSAGVTHSPIVYGPLQDFSPNVAPPVDSPAAIGPIDSAGQNITTDLSKNRIFVDFTGEKSPHSSHLLEGEGTPGRGFKTGTKEHWILWAIGGLAICAVLVLLLRGPTVHITVNTPQPIPTVSVAPNTPTSTHEATQHLSAPSTSTSSLPPQPTTEERIATQMKDAVFLIQVETAGHFWPFATCSAIGKNTLLTSAREASILNKWRNDPENGFKIWITNPASSINKMAVQDIYVNADFMTEAVFMTLEHKPGDWNYYDLALLTVAEELPKTIPVASRKEIAEIEEGLTLYCFGFPHEGGKITKIDKFSPHLVEGKIYSVTPPDLPDHPRFLDIKGKIFKNAFGSPIVNAKGNIIAIYDEAMQSDRDAGENAGQYRIEIHYATVLNPKSINKGLKGEYGEIWISPDLQKTGAEPKDEK